MAYCDRCERYFPHDRALWQHEENSSRHYVCRSCDRDFTTWTSLEQHYVHSRRHHYCSMCNEHFDDDDELDDHNNAEHYYPCDSCDVVFNSSEGLHEHNSEDHWYCDECRRVFQSESNLNSHLNSSIHKPLNVRCPGANCGRAFVSASALMSHFESGTCPSGLTRDQLNRMAVRMDRNNVITNPARLIGGPDGYAPATVTTTWATERSWNGSAYECFLCHGTFRMLRGLNAHLQSPRHQEKIYKCPNRQACGVEFRVLSSLTQHVESGKCGVSMFRDVQSVIDSLSSGVRSIGLY